MISIIESNSNKLAGFLVILAEKVLKNKYGEEAYGQYQEMGMNFENWVGNSIAEKILNSVKGESDSKFLFPHIHADEEAIILSENIKSALGKAEEWGYPVSKGDLKKMLKENL